MKNEKEAVPEEGQQKKAKQKRKGKIAQVYELYKKGASAKEIAEKMKLNERLVRSYLRRSANPEKYRALLQRYFAKKKKQEEIKLAPNNAKKTKKKKEA